MRDSCGNVARYDDPPVVKAGRLGCYGVKEKEKPRGYMFFGVSPLLRKDPSLKTGLKVGRDYLSDFSCLNFADTKGSLSLIGSRLQHE